MRNQTQGIYVYGQKKGYLFSANRHRVPFANMSGQFKAQQEVNRTLMTIVCDLPEVELEYQLGKIKLPEEAKNILNPGYEDEALVHYRKGIIQDCISQR